MVWVAIVNYYHMNIQPYIYKVQAFIVLENKFYSVITLMIMYSVFIVKYVFMDETAPRQLFYCELEISNQKW